MLQFCGLKIGDTEIKLLHKNNNKTTTFLFPQIVRIFYYSGFLVLKPKWQRTRFSATLSGKTLSGKVFVNKNL